VKYLTIKNQMEKYRETKYYITFDIETIEELVNPKLKKKIKIIIIKLEDGL
jgi:prolyl-tRNA synthetase